MANFVEQDINIMQLVARSYGRGVSDKKRLFIKNHFDPKKLVLKVIHDAKHNCYIVFDGKTALQAVKELGNVHTVPCLVYNLSARKAEEMYYAQGGFVRPVNTVDVFLYRYRNNDTNAVGVIEAVHGIRTNKKGKPLFDICVVPSAYRFSCVSCLEKLYKSGELNDVLYVVSQLKDTRHRCSLNVVTMVAKCLRENSKMVKQALIDTINEMGVENCVTISTDRLINETNAKLRANLRDYYNKMNTDMDGYWK